MAWAEGRLSPSARPLPTIRLGDHYELFSTGTVGIPIVAENADDADGVQLIVQYDPSVVAYSHFAGAAWQVVSLNDGADNRVAIRFYRRSGGAAATRGEPLTVGYLGMTFLDTGDLPVNSPDHPFRARSALTIVGANSPEGSYFYEQASRISSHRPLDSKLEPGSVSIYFRSGFELGWGEVNEAYVNFALPLYLTYAGDDKPPLMTGGIDYDELFFHGTGGISPPLASTALLWTPEPVDRGLGLVSFELVFRKGLKGPLVHEHVADLYFTYGNTHTGGDTVEVTPTLVLGPVPPPPLVKPRDGAAGGALDPEDRTPPEGVEQVDGLRGGIGVVWVRNTNPIHFQRGNVTSEKGGPDISSAGRILDFLFLGGERLPCARAADVNANKIVEIGDAVMLLNSLFADGPPPAPPYPDAGFEPEEASPLPCETQYPYFQPQRDQSASRGY